MNIFNQLQKNIDALKDLPHNWVIEVSIQALEQAKMDVMNRTQEEFAQ